MKAPLHGKDCPPCAKRRGRPTPNKSRSSPSLRHELYMSGFGTENVPTGPNRLFTSDDLLNHVKKCNALVVFFSVFLCIGFIRF
uniref:Transmembrane protein n=1 Tax=Caenorhabditis japonica TaxID=281687 RepID=A0A8R1ERF9_CAEJA